MTATQSWQRSGTAEFTVRPAPSVTVITAHGELDAANANQLTVFVERCVDHSSRVVVDLRGLDFCGTAGFSALHRINVVCSGAGVQWVLVVGSAVHRVMRICDPDGTLPTTTSLPEWELGGGIHEAPSGLGLLQLVPQPR
jgi:anti-anti-sigma factor